MVLDCFGLMHAADQAGAMAGRAARVAAGGVLLLQYHSLEAIITVRAVERAAARALRLLLHHRAGPMLAAAGCHPRSRLALPAVRRHRAAGRPARRGRRQRAGPRRWPGRGGAGAARSGRQGRGTGPGRAGAAWAQRARPGRAGCATGWPPSIRPGAGCSATAPRPRAVALLCRAGADRRLLPAVADASPGKQGLRMPGTDIPVISPARLAAGSAGLAVVLFLD